MKYPKFHFIGSKESIWPWIYSNIENLGYEYKSVIDLFGGSGFVSASFREKGKDVYYNDLMKCFQTINLGLLQSNINDLIESHDIKNILSLDNNHSTFIQDYYSKIYFFEEETKWIDNVIGNIFASSYEHNKKGLFFFALSQACLRKRPFNTFHNSFLNLRLKERDKPQSWDKSLEDVFIETIEDINVYLDSIENKNPIPIFNIPATEAKPEIFSQEGLDLVYLDPPFIGGKKRSLKFANYFINYHVLEALANYYSFEHWIDPLSPLNLPNMEHPIMIELNKWLDQHRFLTSLESIISNFSDSKIVLSFRNDSFIKINQIKEIFSSYKEKITTFEEPHIYNKKGKAPKFNDILLIAK